ncbi:MAG: hypothetical protein R8K53_00775 [Mariprofundaceae bacterium]
MSSVQTMRPYSRKILIRMVVALLLAAILVVFNYNFIADIYLNRQLTSVGLIINGGIFLLFVIGMAKITIALFSYADEEKALGDFVDQLDEDNDDPATGIAPDSIISHRFAAMEQLHNHHTPINHNAMASSLLAAESTRGSTPRFINNILILGGVFGTIVSLSIALIGASDMLENAISSTGMGLVIHGMSTALTTTITAILCYILHGYFFNALGDVQTRLLGRIEEITATRLMPMFQVDQKTIDYRVAELLRAMAEMIQRMDDGQSGVLAITEQLQSIIGEIEGERGEVRRELADIRDILRDGFRLPDTKQPEHSPESNNP